VLHLASAVKKGVAVSFNGAPSMAKAGKGEAARKPKK
jgi:hypothetical protein